MLFGQLLLGDFVVFIIYLFIVFCCSSLRWVGGVGGVVFLVFDFFPFRFLNILSFSFMLSYLITYSVWFTFLFIFLLCFSFDFTIDSFDVSFKCLNCKGLASSKSVNIFNLFILVVEVNQGKGLNYLTKIVKDVNVL